MNDPATIASKSGVLDAWTKLGTIPMLGLIMCVGLWSVHNNQTHIQLIIKTALDAQREEIRRGVDLLKEIHESRKP